MRIKKTDEISMTKFISEIIDICKEAKNMNFNGLQGY